MTTSARHDAQTRTYLRGASVVFKKTAEEFGGLSNMAPGYPVEVVGVRIRTSEALYQACRFPHLPAVQHLIIDQLSPMVAKMKGKPYRDRSREDWMQVRVSIMRWSLMVKLAQNWRTFGELLFATGDRPIVEESTKDDFWGAKPVETTTLVGRNVLGRLLMDLRERLRARRTMPGVRIDALPIPNFSLCGRLIKTMNIRFCTDENDLRLPQSGTPQGSEEKEQAELFRQIENSQE